ncbi:MAG: hypothetical protein GXY44_00185 [Phycisphaerales bacterium]|nr:hypothetical protein [Phycisphaerales bacterium]
MAFWLVVCIVTMAIAGCASTGATGEFGPPTECLVCSPVYDQAPEFAAGMIFDRRPGYFQATDFARRSSWPSTDTFYSPSQVVEFQERFVDYQGRSSGQWDYTYRRFDTRRTGFGYR